MFQFHTSSSSGSTSSAPAASSCSLLRSCTPPYAVPCAWRCDVQSAALDRTAGQHLQVAPALTPKTVPLECTFFNCMRLVIIIAHQLPRSSESKPKPTMLTLCSSHNWTRKCC